MENIAIILSLVFSIISLYCAYKSMKKSNDYKRLYDNSLAKFNNTANVKDKFSELFTRLNDVEEKCNNTVLGFDKISSKIKTNEQKYGLVKYNAYGEDSNNLSFALAILNGDNSGIILTSIYTIQSSSIYCKQVVNGNVDVRISDEEIKALEIATQTPMREEVIANEIKKVNINAGLRNRKIKLKNNKS